MKNIFTKTLLASVFFILSLNAFSQSGWDTLPWKSYADFRLQSLNKSYISTGVLYDGVFPIANMDEHTGLSTDEDTTSSDHFKQGYYEMYNAADIQVVEKYPFKNQVITPAIIYQISLFLPKKKPIKL